MHLTKKDFLEKGSLFLLSFTIFAFKSPSNSLFLNILTLKFQDDEIFIPDLCPTFFRIPNGL